MYLAPIFVKGLVLYSFKYITEIIFVNNSDQTC